VAIFFRAISEICGFNSYLVFRIAYCVAGGCRSSGRAAFFAAPDNSAPAKNFPLWTYKTSPLFAKRP
jgi:hypothetical protein